MSVMLSYKLFDIIEYFLDEYLLGKETRNLVFLMDDLFTDLQQEFAKVKTTELISGSGSEAMMNGNDFDVMVCQPDFVVFNNASEVPDELKSSCILLMESNNCYPGFTKLVLQKDIPNQTDDLYIYCDGKNYLSRGKYLNYVCKKMFGTSNLTMHGPAVLQEKGASDVVICLPYPVWPRCASDFINRHRKYAIPSDLQIEGAKEIGCHVVPVAHPNSLNDDLEFRISFSMVEKYMIRQWNEKQLKCYYLCKELFSNHLKPLDETDKGMCSYFAKTIIFWLIESNPEEYWHRTHIFDLMKNIFVMAKEFLLKSSCQNYFVPENLMMETFSKEQRQSLLKRIEIVEQDLGVYVLSCDMFKSLSPNIELLSSIYQIVREMGDKTKAEYTLESIYNELPNSFDKIIAFNGSLISRKRDLYQFHTVLLLTRLMALLLRGNWAYQTEPIGPLLGVCTVLYEKYGSKYTYNELTFCKNCIERCLATHMLTLSFILEHEDKNAERDETLSAVESLFISASDFPSFLNDNNTSSKVSLGLLYYLIGRHDAAMKVLFEAVFSASELIAENFGCLIALPIVIGGDGMRSPRFFQKHSTLRELFEYRHLHIVALDPLVLALFLLIDISREKEMLLVRFAKLKEYLETTYILKGPLYHSTIDSYNYFKFKLGLMEEGSQEHMEQSEPGSCLHCCEFMYDNTSRTAS